MDGWMDGCLLVLFSGEPGLTTQFPIRREYERTEEDKGGGEKGTLALPLVSHFASLLQCAELQVPIKGSQSSYSEEIY